MDITTIPPTSSVSPAPTGVGRAQDWLARYSYRTEEVAVDVQEHIHQAFRLEDVPAILAQVSSR